MERLIEALVEQHGEKWRRLIVDSLEWIIANEPKWGISIDKREFVEDLVTRAELSNVG